MNDVLLLSPIFVWTAVESFALVRGATHQRSSFLRSWSLAESTPWLSLASVAHLFVHCSSLEVFDTIIRYMYVSLGGRRSAAEVYGGIVGGALAARLALRWVRCIRDHQSTRHGHGILRLVVSSLSKHLLTSEGRLSHCGGSPIVVCIAGYRAAYHGDFAAATVVVPSACRRMLRVLSRAAVLRDAMQGRSSLVDAVWSMLGSGHNADTLQSAEEMGADLAEEVHDWVDLTAFACGGAAGLLRTMWFYCRLGYRAAHGRNVGFADRVGQQQRVLDGNALPFPLPIHPSIPLLQAFDNGVAPEEFVCPLTRVLFENPVIAADGHTYEASDMAQWLQRSDISPVAGTPLEHKLLIPNYALRSMMERWHA